MHRVARALIVPALAIPTLTLGVLLAGCGNSDPSGDAAATTSVAKRAAAGFVAQTNTCDEHSSWTYRPRFANLSSRAVVLRAGEYTCDDWSGVSTPGNVFNGIRMYPGEQRFTLEPRDNVTRTWTMEISPAGSDTPFGTARMLISVGTQTLTVSGSSTVAIAGGKKCDYLQLAPTGDFDTPMSEWSRLPGRASLGFVVYKGQFTVVSDCREENPAPAPAKK